jgi:hypothetical protein
MTQDYLRAAHRTGRLIEITFDTPRDEPPVLESGVPRKRAPRVPGGRSAKERKRMQRQRDGWRPELFELTGDQELVASVCDRDAYIRALEIHLQREKRRADDEIEYRVRLCHDNGEFASWQSLGVTGPRIVVQCLEEDMRRGNGARPRTRPVSRLSEENRAALEFTEVFRVFDGDETSDVITSSVGDGLVEDKTGTMSA